MKEMMKLICSLGAICLVGSAALTWVYSTTEKPIRQAAERALTADLKKVLPPETAATETLDESGTNVIYAARDAGKRVIGYAVQSIGKGGFGGEVKVLVGFLPNGTIRAVMITEHKETPGIGSKATDRKVQRTLMDVLRGKKVEDSFPPNAFLDSFAGKNAQEGVSTVQGVSGATYSSRAVTAGIDEACRALKEYLQKEMK